MKPGIKKKFTIVGMGASAGGLEAFESFFNAMPNNNGMAFVLISHLDPNHISILPELIQKRTQMKVLMIEDGIRIQPNCVYTIPPNKDVAIFNGVLHLMDLPRPRGLNLPIDNFLKSLARDQGDNAVCIILSGTGSDGTLGLKHIKDELGMAMVQDEICAKFDGMPSSAIATGLADFILPAKKMPEILIKYSRHAIIECDSKVSTVEEKFLKSLQKIYMLLRSYTHLDFSPYKRNTIIRRIERRMHVHQIDNIEHYVTYLTKNEREIHILFKDLLIGVTQFFRDSTAFDMLRDRYLIKMISDNPDNTNLRVWVPGCSTGEEAYSLAILLQECMEKMNRHVIVQIFATDLDEDAIHAARAGRYPVSIASDVNPERIKRFFTREDSYFKISKSIREMIVFAPQNLITDPPFTRLDMLSCRNLLIYFDPKLQQKLLSMFYYSLKPNGILFLGSAESVDQETNLFKLSGRKWKIFKRRANLISPHPIINFPLSSLTDIPVVTKLPDVVKRAEEINNFRLMETILQNVDTPPCVLIDEKLNIVYIHGRTGRYLEPAVGRMCNNILEMARPGLKVALASSIRKAATLKHDVTLNEIDIEENDGFIRINLTVKPVWEYGGIQGLLMVVFHDLTTPKNVKTPKADKKNQTITLLEQELKTTKEDLKSTIEELEISNEELQSINEELQSTNEELETSKEELQSLNEESATVNAELRTRINEYSDANDDMKNLLNSTQIGTLFLDMDLNVRRFNDMSTKLIHLTSSDIGRPISHLTTELKQFALVDHSRQVLTDLITQEVEVQSRDGKVFRTRVMPYRTMQNVIDGVVVTFEDITKFKKDNLIAQRLSVLMESQEAVIILNKNGGITFWNSGAQKLYGYTEKEAYKMNIRDIVLEEKIEESLLFMKTAFSNKTFDCLETHRRTKENATIRIRHAAIALRDEKDAVKGILTIERQIKDDDPAKDEHPT